MRVGNKHQLRPKDRREEGALGGPGGRLSRRNLDPVAEAERKAQQEKLYALDLDKIMAGADKRTTLMIKNIPNKYTQKMLLSTIDEYFSGTYDFFYLPIDFKNKCNVGYAFINLIKPEYIVPLVEKFNQKKWEKFNSEKVCNISYARIQVCCCCDVEVLGCLTGGVGLSDRGHAGFVMSEHLLTHVHNPVCRPSLCVCMHISPRPPQTQCVPCPPLQHTHTPHTHTTTTGQAGAGCTFPEQQPTP